MYLMVDSSYGSRIGGNVRELGIGGGSSGRIERLIRSRGSNISLHCPFIRLVSSSSFEDFLVFRRSSDRRLVIDDLHHESGAANSQITCRVVVYEHDAVVRARAIRTHCYSA